MVFVGNVPCCPLCRGTDPSPGSGLEIDRDGTVSKEIIPWCRRNWLGFFLCPLLSLTVKGMIIEIKLYFSPWSLLEGWVYPMECHLPQTTEVSYPQGDENWSGKSRY